MKLTIEQANAQAKIELSNTIIRLLSKQPYYASFLMNMKKEFTTRFKNAGVSVTDTINLYLNPFFFLDIDNDSKEGLVIHEIKHIANGHLARAKDLEPEVYDKSEKTIGQAIKDMLTHSAINYSTDAAINEHIPNIPKNFKCFDKDGNVIVEPNEIINKNGKKEKNPNAGNPVIANPITVEYLEKVLQKPLEKNKNFEYYYKFIKEEKNNKGNNGEDKDNYSTIDDHGSWQESSDNAEYMIEKIRQFVKKSIDDAQGINAGDIPVELLQMVEWLNRPTRDWRKEIQNIAARTSEIKIETSRKIRNRRYGFIYPGNKIYPSLHIAFLVDSSGSVHNEALNQAYAEIGRLHKLGAKITVVTCDTKVNDIYEFDPKKKPVCTGRGGTMFQPGLVACEKLDVDCIFFATDCNNSDHSAVKSPKMPLYWLIYEGCEKYLQYKFGKRIEIKINKKIK